MRLLIDIGNSRIKWAFADRGKLELSSACLQRDGTTGAYEVADWLEQLQHTPTSACVVNVGGSDVENVLRALLLKQYAVKLQALSTTKRCGEVVNGYRTIEQLGADRWAVIVAAWHIYRGPVCVIDAGTAATIDFVAANGLHLGGVIVPGLALMQSSLRRDTSDIGLFISQSDGQPAAQGWYGRETKAAVEQGAKLMLCAAINAAANDFLATYPDGNIILTGGAGEQLAPLLDHAVQLRPALVLEGLNLLADDADA